MEDCWAHRIGKQSLLSGSEVGGVKAKVSPDREVELRVIALHVRVA